MNQRTIAILGATGSIGTQALDIVRRHPDRFFIRCLTAGSSAEKLFELVREFRPRSAALAVEPREIPEDVRFCDWYFGEEGAAMALQVSGAQDALCAIVGIAGLSGAWTALDVCRRVLLANKEALVTAGELMTRKAARLHKPILPVDSEHSAIYQCLQAANGNPPARLILTASGGALRQWPLDRLGNATPADVMRHPTWKMGAKITVDCATMLNKGLEAIEAHHLFDMPMEKIEIVVHPQSVIHSMVEFRDGAVLAQLGAADMRGPIGYAMGFPERIPFGGTRLDFQTLGQLTFLPPDEARYPCMKLAIDARKAGGTACALMNAANEVAVAAFLKGQIPFGSIPKVIARVLDRLPAEAVHTLEDVYEADRRARRAALSALEV